MPTKLKKSKTKSLLPDEKTLRELFSPSLFALYDLSADDLQWFIETYTGTDDDIPPYTATGHLEWVLNKTEQRLEEDYADDIAKLAEVRSKFLPKETAIETEQVAAEHPRKPRASRSGQRKLITTKEREKVHKLHLAGKSGFEIARAVGISLPSVHNIKKQLGLLRL